MKKKLLLLFLCFGFYFVVPAAVPIISYSTPLTYVKGAVITPLSPHSTGGAVPAGVTVSTLCYADFPLDVETDASGNMYVSSQNNVIYKVTPAGVVNVFAGSGWAGSNDDTGIFAAFNMPTGIAIDALGNVYVADCNNHMIRKISSTGEVTTLAGSTTSGSADGIGTAATFFFPTGVAVDISGNVYVVDSGNNLIRKITSAGVVTTLAGSGAYGGLNGTGTAANFSALCRVIVDSSGNLLVTDNNMIRKITPAGVVTTWAGSSNDGSANGTITSATFNGPNGIALDASENLYMADTGNNLIRKISSSGVVTTLAGSTTPGYQDGVCTSAAFESPRGITADASGNLYVADYANSMIRKIAPTGYSVSPNLPAGLSLDAATGVISGTPTTITAAADYTITATNTGGSGTCVINITVKDVGTGVENSSMASVSVYPNPSNDYIQIVGFEGVAAITICDLNGKTLIAQQIMGNEKISLRSLLNGMYVAKINTSTGSIVKKIVKQ